MKLICLFSFPTADNTTLHNDKVEEFNVNKATAMFGLHTFSVKKVAFFH